MKKEEEKKETICIMVNTIFDKHLKYIKKKNNKKKNMFKLDSKCKK